ncbi:hypothetical protein [Rhodoferax sp.]|uniref:hypothetical protein n=1 Tax=Rhodoferax sp. TaxID=50421 RepID=UPI002612A3A2|nr:hypothetical protein [Rhodoferax sp.]MDD2918352.1 hypothetical protein [Rhodoferax sp.]
MQTGGIGMRIAVGVQMRILGCFSMPMSGGIKLLIGGGFHANIQAGLRGTVNLQNMSFKDASAGRVVFYGFRNVTIDQAIHDLARHTNRQHQWFLAESYELWAAAGFKDTLLRWSMKQEIANGKEKAIQPGVQG